LPIYEMDELDLVRIVSVEVWRVRVILENVQAICSECSSGPS